MGIYYMYMYTCGIATVSFPVYQVVNSVNL